MDWPLGIDTYLGGNAEITSNPNQFRSLSSKAFYDCPTTAQLTNNTTVFDTDYGIPSKPGPNDASYNGYKRAIISKPSEALLLADCYLFNDNTRGRSAFRQGHNYEEVTGFSDSSFKHLNRSANYSFIDGHAKSIRWIPETPFQNTYLYDLYNSLNDGIAADSQTYVP